MTHGDTLIELARVMDDARSAEMTRSVTAGRASSDSLRRMVGRVLVRTGERLSHQPARAGVP